jgi:uncharacterized membrane protein YfcA
MSIFIAPPEAAGIMLPILCAMDLFGVHAYRGSWSREHLRALVPGALAGIGIGALAFGALPVNAIRLLIGLIAVSFALNSWFGTAEQRDRRAKPADCRRLWEPPDLFVAHRGTPFAVNSAQSSTKAVRGPR